MPRRLVGRLSNLVAFLVAVLVAGTVACAQQTASDQTAVPPIPTRVETQETVPSATAVADPTAAPTSPATAAPASTPESQPTPGPTPVPAETPPTAGPTPQPPVAPKPEPPPPADVTTSLARSIPSIDARLTDLRFFDAPRTTPSLADRVYRERFDSVTSRFIGWEIGLAYPVHGRNVEFEIVSHVRDANGDVIFEEKRTAEVESDWTFSYHFAKQGDGPGRYLGPWLVLGAGVG